MLYLEPAMATMVLDEDLAERLIAERQASGGDRYDDEVWEGVYMMAPLANNEHQDIQFGLASALHGSVGSGKGRVQAGANVSDREGADPKDNYRCPDVVVVLNGGRAIDGRTHWFGGPDFAVEIVSKQDRSRDKFGFYASVGVRELLLVDRFPWSLELYRLAEGKLELVARSRPDDGNVLQSSVVPDSFRLLSGPSRPQIEVIHQDGVQRWLV